MSGKMMSPEVLGVAAATVIGIGAEAGVLLFSTVGYEHRKLTHKSMDISPSLGVPLHVIMEPKTNPNGWAATHEVHHHVPDANLYPFIQIADYLDYRDENLDKIKDHPPVPETFGNLDRAALDLDLAKVYEIGAVGRELVDGKYTPKEEYTAEEATTILDTEKIRYLYEKTSGKHDPLPTDDQVWTLEDVKFLLRDPHSPALHPETVRGIVRDNVWLYSDVERRFHNNNLLPERLARNSWQEKLYKHRKLLLGVEIGAHIIGAAGIGYAIGQRRPSQIIRNGLAGGIIMAGATYALVKGGQVVNGFGHGGEDPKRAFKYNELIPRSNGAYTTNGSFGFGWWTGDEVDWQGNHHDHPDWIAYATTWRKAPLGKALEFIAKRHLLLHEANGFGDETRPDMVHPAVKMIEAERVRSMELGHIALAA